MIKYPIEIEFTDHCGLKCISCISKDIKNKGFLSLDDFNLLMEFILENSLYIDYITLGGLGDNFIHPNAINYLEKLKCLKGKNISILIPTKGLSLSNDIINKIIELKNTGLKINIQLGVFSLRENVLNYMTGFDLSSGFSYYNNFINLIKKLKLYKLDFSLELILTKISEKEIDHFQNFCYKLNVDGVIHRLHNFGGKLKTYDQLYTKNKHYNAFHCSYDKSLENSKDGFYNDLCGFFPYIKYNLSVFPGTFCTHYKGIKLKDYLYFGGFDKLIKDIKSIIDLDNKFCKKCTDNLKYNQN